MKSGKLISWNPLGHSRPVTGLLYSFLPFILHDGRSTKKEKKCYTELLIYGIIFDESIVMQTNHPVKNDKRAKKI
jgi:hypothetical protein